MVEMIVLISLAGVLGLLGLVGGGMYLADPKGWQATFKRLSRTTRAHVEAGKPAKAIEKVKPKEIEQWDAEFKGVAVAGGSHKAVAPKPQARVHKIAETWFEYNAYVNSTKYHFKCSCGHTGGRWDKGLAAADFRVHVREATQADKAKASGSKLQW